MHHLACKVSLAPLYSQPSLKGSLISQMLFGESAEVLERSGSWALLRCAWDGLEAWADSRHFVAITSSEYVHYHEIHAISMTLLDGIMSKESFLPITLGAVLPVFDGLRGHLGEETFQFSGAVIFPDKAPRTGEMALKIARRYLFAPETHGGRSPLGIDAAALVQMAFKPLGVRLFRSADQQVNQGRTIDFMEQCQAGDLAFFDDGKGQIGHVGIIGADCSVIHAHGQVRTDKLDHFGIFDHQTGKYSHQLRVVKRLLKDEPKESKEGAPTYQQSMNAVASGVVEINQGSLFEG